MEKTDFAAESFTFSDDSVIAFLSHKSAGSMKINKENPSGLATRAALLEKVGIENTQVISAGLVHRGDVASVHAGEAGTIIPQVDGLITNETDVFVSVTVADCLPIFFYAPDVQAVGVAHGGWKPLRDGIVEHTLGALSNQYGADPAQMQVCVGPGIGQCHFDVNEDVLEAFSSYLEDVRESREGRDFVDLSEIVRIKLLKSGMNDENISVSPACTYCGEETYFSYRRDHEPILSTMLALIGMRSE